MVDGGLLADLGLWLATVWATIGLPLAFGVESDKLRLAADNYAVFSCIIHQKTDSDLARYCQFSPFGLKIKNHNWRKIGDRTCFGFIFRIKMV